MDARVLLRFCSLLVACSGPACGDPCPTERPPRLTDCDPDATGSGCATQLVVTDEVTVSESYFECSGFDPDEPDEGVSDPCQGHALASTPGAESGGQFYSGFFVGWFYELEVDESGERARFCRRYWNDSPSLADSCWPAEWSCAESGTVAIVQTGPGQTTGELHAVFPGGETVDAAW